MKEKPIRSQPGTYYFVSPPARARDPNIPKHVVPRVDHTVLYPELTPDCTRYTSNLSLRVTPSGDPFGDGESFVVLSRPVLTD